MYMNVALHSPFPPFDIGLKEQMMHVHMHVMNGHVAVKLHVPYKLPITVSLLIISFILLGRSSLTHHIPHFLSLSQHY